MFERFTDGARDAVVHAQVEARSLRHGYIGTEHLLLAVAHLQDRVAGRVLRSLGIGEDQLRASVVRSIGRGPGPVTDADADALEAIGIDLDEVRERIEETFGPGALDRPVRWSGSRRRCGWWLAPGHIPFTPRAKKALELSLREARRLGHSYIGTEHILLGLVREGEGVAAQLLRDAGATPDGVRRAVIDELSRRLDPPSASA